MPHPRSNTDRYSQRTIIERQRSLNCIDEERLDDIYECVRARTSQKRADELAD